MSNWLSFPCWFRKTALLLGLFICNGVVLTSIRADATENMVSVTKKAPIETISAGGDILAVGDASVGAKMTFVGTDGAQVKLKDAQGTLYRINADDTDYVAMPPVVVAPAASDAPVVPRGDTTPSQATTGPAPAGEASEDKAPDFGPNVFVFDPTTDPAALQSKCDAIFSTQERSEFGSNRYAFLFKPGTYNAKIRVGFYTQVYGLGKMPDDVTINGEVRCDGDWDNGNCTLNFWRGCENLAIVPGDSSDMWAVSQAAPFRRVHVKGALNLFQVHDGAGGWASGGFMADCKVDGQIVPGSQQQWFSRNSAWNDWTNGVWNMVFVGITNPPQGTWPDKPYTTVGITPSIREKPFLCLNATGHYQVFVPAERKNSQGTTWESGPTAGDSIPLTQFYIAQAGRDSADTLNAALAGGKNLLLTPGIYHLDKPVRVTRPDTIVLGIGMPTLFPDHGTSAMEIADVSGVKLACILFDAGPVTSPVLLQVGEPGSHQSHASDPTLLSDIFCRVGGAAVGVTKTCVVINSNDVVGDHAWIWRADHGAGSAWNENKSTNGLIVNGANVTYYGLFVEHFQEDQTLWNGENGHTYFYQCEMPYDPPTQTAWQHGTVEGWPGYKVADSVQTHEAWGMGIYCCFTQPDVHSESAVEAPKNAGVKFHNVLTFYLSGAATTGINHVINDMGGAATAGDRKQMVMESAQ
jgi:hypothetical protein